MSKTRVLTRGVSYNFCKTHVLLHVKFRQEERDTHPENRTFGNS